MIQLRHCRQQPGIRNIFQPCLVVAGRFIAQIRAIDARSSSCCFSVIAFIESSNGVNPSLILCCASCTPRSSALAIRAWNRCRKCSCSTVNLCVSSSRDAANWRSDSPRRPLHGFRESIQFLPRVPLNFIHERRSRGVRCFRKQIARPVKRFAHHFVHLVLRVARQSCGSNDPARR